MGNTKTQILLLEDEQVNVKDIKRTVSSSNREIVEIKPKNFFEAISKATFEFPDGILIDINLNKLNLENVSLNSTEIADGVDVAQFLFDFNPCIPIAIYSANLEHYRHRLSKINRDEIFVFPKTAESFPVTLKPFLDKVDRVKRQRQLLRKAFEHYNFQQLPESEKRKLMIQRLEELNTRKYFEAVGNYAWFFVCRKVVKQWHGPIIPEMELRQEQKMIKSEEEIGIKEKIEGVLLKQMWEEKQDIPLVFLNLHSVHELKANLALYSRDIFNKSPQPWQFMLHYQIAQKLSSCIVGEQLETEDGFSLIEKLNEAGKEETQSAIAKKLSRAFLRQGFPASKIKQILSKLNQQGQLAFQQDVLWEKRWEISHANEIPKIFEPIASALSCSILDIFEGEIDTIEKEDNREASARVLLENIFKDDVKEWRKFKLRVLEKRKITEEGSRFLYVFYENRQGDLSRYLKLLTNV